MVRGKEGEDSGKGAEESAGSKVSGLPAEEVAASEADNVESSDGGRVCSSGSCGKVILTSAWTVGIARENITEWKTVKSCGGHWNYEKRKVNAEESKEFTRWATQGAGSSGRLRAGGKLENPPLQCNACGTRPPYSAVGLSDYRSTVWIADYTLYLAIIGVMLFCFLGIPIRFFSIREWATNLVLHSRLCG
jgi:hypothetical protein